MVANKRSSNSDPQGPPPSKKQNSQAPNSQSNGEQNASLEGLQQKRLGALEKCEAEANSMGRKRSTGALPKSSGSIKSGWQGGSMNGVSNTLRQETEDDQAKKTFNGANIEITAYDGAVPTSLGTTTNSDTTQPINQAESFLPLISGGVLFENPIPVDPEFFSTIRTFTPSETPPERPWGLRNPGDQNWCYRNAVITALLSSKRFVAYICGWHMPREYDNNASLQEKRYNMLTLLDGIGRVLNDGKSTRSDVEEEIARFRDRVMFPKGISEAKIRTYLPIGSWRGTPGDTRATLKMQCDASEFLQWILDSIAAQLSSKDTLIDVPFDHLEMIRRTQRHCCPNCQWRMRVRRPTIDPARILLLHIPGSDKDPSSEEYNEALHGTGITNMAECMSYSMRSIFDADYVCSRCQTNGAVDPVVRQFKLQTAPEVIFMSLVRFVRNANTGIMEKLFTKVPIEEEFDVGPWLEPHNYGEGTSIRYKLVAVVSHQGPYSSSNENSRGHYHSYIRGGKNTEQWWELDDDKVSPVQFSDFNDAQPWSEEEDGNFDERFTPYCMIYEKVHGMESIKDGRQAMNPSDNTPTDERPAYWLDEWKAEHAAAEQVVADGSLHNLLDKAVPDLNEWEGAEPGASSKTHVPAAAPHLLDNSQSSLSSLFSGSPDPLRKQNSMSPAAAPRAPVAAYGDDTLHLAQPTLDVQAINQPLDEQLVTATQIVDSQQEANSQGKASEIAEVVVMKDASVQAGEATQKPNEEHIKPTSGATAQVHPMTKQHATTSTSPVQPVPIPTPASTSALAAGTQTQPITLPGPPEDEGSEAAVLNVKVRI
ncbi:hypothetical protein H2198_009310, partial [Neophaeococcomyces mojaviensis]